MPGVLIFGAAADRQLSEVSLEVASAGQELARSMGVKLYGALIGSGCAAAAQAFARAGMSDLLVIDDARLSPYAGDIHLAAADRIISKCSPSVILFPQTAETSEWVPRLAARLKAALVTACTRIAYDGRDLVAIKPVSGGALQAEYAFNRDMKIATLSPGFHESVQDFASRPPCPITALDLPETPARVTVIETIPDAAGSGPSLKDAHIVVSGGLGIGNRDNWAIVEEAAAALGAAIGATRAVVDLGWVPAAQQVGFSGLKVRPDLYLALGLSGAVHHLAGIAGAKTVVAINSDAEANIFRVARFGVVGDVNAVIPAFVERVKELRARSGQD